MVNPKEAGQIAVEIDDLLVLAQVYGLKRVAELLEAARDEVFGAIPLGSPQLPLAS